MLENTGECLYGRRHQFKRSDPPPLTPSLVSGPLASFLSDEMRDKRSQWEEGGVAGEEKACCGEFGARGEGVGGDRVTREEGIAK